MDTCYTQNTWISGCTGFINRKKCQDTYCPKTHKTYHYLRYSHKRHSHQYPSLNSPYPIPSIDSNHPLNAYFK